MSLEIVFKLSLYSLTALVAWILGAAENGWIPYATLPLVVVGFFWTDTRRRWSNGLNETLASTCGFFALAAAVNEYVGPVNEAKLLAGTHLLVYLTWILLLQPKTNRRYWLLLAIGVIQLALASVLISHKATIWFGFCAIAYVCSAIWTMTVFSLFRSARQFASVSGRDASRYSVPGTTISPGRLPISTGSRSFDSVQNEHGTPRWLSLGFAGGVAITTMYGLFISALFFALIPRVWISSAVLSAEDSVARRGGRTGFTENVQLGDMGAILESMDPVLELRLFDDETKRPLSPQIYAERLGLSEPLFRGAVLSTYESRGWKADLQSAQYLQPLIKPTKRKLVRQDIRLQGIATDVVFYMGYLLGLENNKKEQKEPIRGRYELATGILHRTLDQARQPVSYSAYTDLPALDAPEKGFVEIPDVNRRRYHEIGYLKRITTVPKGVERLSALAREIVDNERRRKNGKLSDTQVVRAIEEYLRDSGIYKYSISLSIQDPKIDPVEDFLFNRKSGHCEYFASALVLMLRSVGIPARLISGFKGGVYEAPTNILKVQQRHAHAWCEAWVNNRGWVTCDSTPMSERSSSVEAVSSNHSVWNDMRSQLAGIWSANVVDLSLDKQKELIYLPVQELMESIGGVVRELWTSPDTSIFSFGKLLIDPLSWFSFRGAATLFVVSGTLWIAYRVAIRLRKRWAGWQHRRRVSRTRQLVEFYERFGKLMHSLGLRRTDTQTQREFAQLATDTLRLRLQTTQLDRIPAEISELFYKVRFGDEPLPEDEAQRAEELLSSLESWLLAPSPK